MASDFDHCRELVYAGDRDRFFSSLFAPEDKRQGLLALYAFNLEVARVRDVVKDPLPGEIRLQWWRDFLQGREHGDASANPIANALLETIKRYQLPTHALVAMVDARIFDLYNDPMPSLNDLEGYCGETVSALFQLSCLILNGGKDADTADISGHAGVAYGLTGLLRALPWHASRGQMYLPTDVLERHGVQSDCVFKGEATPELAAALSEMREHARHHLRRVGDKVPVVADTLRPGFLPLALVSAFLAKMEKPGYEPLKTPVELSQLRRQWLIWRASRQATLGL